MPADQDINAVIVQRSIHSDQGGLATLTTLLCDALVACKVSTTLVTRMEKAGREEMVLPRRPEVVLCFSGTRRRPSPADFFDRLFTRTIKAAAREAGKSIIHTQDIWTPEVHLAVQTARKLKIPLVMSITGTLTPWSLKYKATKKEIGWLLYQKRDLASASVLHATSRREASEIRRLGLVNPIAIIPLAVELSKNPEPETRLSPDRNKPRTVLYLSRIHEKKGLIHLVQAWDRLRPRGWQVVIAGQDDFGYRAILEAEIARRGLEEDFLFLGFVSREEKAGLYRRADLFVLPTYSENFGLVVPEALSHSLPVITTTGTPWEDLRAHRCGWWIETGTEPLVRTLQEAFALSDQERGEMGDRGRKLVEAEYSPRRLGEQMKVLYLWLTGRGPVPPFIVW